MYVVQNSMPGSVLSSILFIRTNAQEHRELFFVSLSIEALALSAIYNVAVMLPKCAITYEMASIHSLLERPLPPLGSSRCSASPTSDITENERASLAAALDASEVVPRLRPHHATNLPVPVTMTTTSIQW